MNVPGYLQTTPLSIPGKLVVGLKLVLSVLGAIDVGFGDVELVVMGVELARLVDDGVVTEF